MLDLAVYVHDQVLSLIVLPVAVVVPEPEPAAGAGVASDEVTVLGSCEVLGWVWA